MRRTILLLAFFFKVFFANAQANDVLGLLTPININEKTTIIELPDYFMNPARIMRVEVDNSLKTDLAIDKKMLTLTAVGKVPLLSNMEIILQDGQRYSIPVKSPAKKPVHYIARRSTDTSACQTPRSAAPG